MIPNKDIFCSSPWLHVRINYDGKFVPCRWGTWSEYSNNPTECNIRVMSMIEYFNSAPMVKLRNQLLLGEAPDLCSSCYYDSKFDKVTGRDKQLFRSNLASAKSEQEFEIDFYKSSHYELFKYSQDHTGLINTGPIDLQIDLSNVCNSACIMCSPVLSTRLNADYIKLRQTHPGTFTTIANTNRWADDPTLLSKFINELHQLPDLQYIHFLGGETLYIESFYTICDALIESGLAKKIIIGTTTNGTIYSDRLINIIPEFKGFHLGCSIESVNPLNDYIRYPSEIYKVLDVFKKFLDFRCHCESLHIQLRITPNIFSIYYLDELIQFMCDNNCTAESCFILYNPTCLRVELLPGDLKQIAIQKLQTIVEKNNLVRAPQNPDTRNLEVLRQIISNVTYGYIDFLTNMKPPDDVEAERYKLVQFLKGFESLRGNSILDYAPEYTDFLKSYGY